MKHGRSAGFSLIEIAVAVSVIGFCAIALLMILSNSVNDTRSIRDETIALLLARNVRTLLLEPAWPLEKKPAPDGWRAQVFFDGNCAIAEAERATIRAELVAQGGPGFESVRAEAVRVIFIEIDSGRELGSYILQRQTRTQAEP
ncbi:MAG: hypothetical protein JWL59_2047 [Chthoniobacteraceae bacterium]|nr:hypothetical protein [Chthoniobacteraceae bacterium]